MIWFFGSGRVRIQIKIMVWVGHKFKGEIQVKLNLISEERVTIFKQNSENLMKIG